MNLKNQKASSFISNDRVLDKFYTKSDIAKSVISHVNLAQFDLIIEPSAGSGSFSKELFERKYPVLAMDIEPESDNILRQNWFDYRINQNYKKVLVIGNPPFGKNNNMSKAFLKHAFSFENVHTVAFILPDVFKKYTLQSVIPENYFINEIISLPKNSFLLSGAEHHVPCSFFIISKNNYRDLRQDREVISSDFFFSTKKDYDFFVYGAAPKKIIELPNKNSRGYYIKSKIDKNLLKQRFESMNWEGHSSANGGVFWLTKVDFIENYTKFFNKLEKEKK